MFRTFQLLQSDPPSEIANAKSSALGLTLTDASAMVPSVEKVLGSSKTLASQASQSLTMNLLCCQSPELK